jgi:hypothetical protein
MAKPGQTFNAAGLNLATLLYKEFKLYQPLQGFDGPRANRLLKVMCSKGLWEQGKLGPGVHCCDACMDTHIIGRLVYIRVGVYSFEF